MRLAREESKVELFETIKSWTESVAFAMNRAELWESDLCPAVRSHCWTQFLKSARSWHSLGSKRWTRRWISLDIPTQDEPQQDSATAGQQPLTPLPASESQDNDLEKEGSPAAATAVPDEVQPDAAADGQDASGAATADTTTTDAEATGIASAPAGDDGASATASNLGGADQEGGEEAALKPGWTTRDTPTGLGSYLPHTPDYTGPSAPYLFSLFYTSFYCVNFITTLYTSFAPYSWSWLPICLASRYLTWQSDWACPFVHWCK